MITKTESFGDPEQIRTADLLLDRIITLQILHKKKHLNTLKVYFPVSHISERL